MIKRTIPRVISRYCSFIFAKLYRNTFYVFENNFKERKNYLNEYFY